MINADIVKIKKPLLHYKCDNPDEIRKEGFLVSKIDFEVEEFKNIHKVDFELRLKIFSVSKKDLSDKELENSESEAFFHVKYRVLIDSELTIDDFTEEKIVQILEAYIKKDALDFYNEIELPNIKLPIFSKG